MTLFGADIDTLRRGKPVESSTVKPTADEIIMMFHTDIDALRREGRKPPIMERTRQWRIKHRKKRLEYDRRYQCAHHPKP